MWPSPRGVPFFHYDPTVNGSPIERPEFRFHKLGWAAADGPADITLVRRVGENGIENDNDVLLIRCGRCRMGHPARTAQGTAVASASRAA